MSLPKNWKKLVKQVRDESWKQKTEILTGAFVLPLSWKKEWLKWAELNGNSGDETY